VIAWSRQTRARVESIELDTNVEYFRYLIDMHFSGQQTPTASATKLDNADLFVIEQARQLCGLKNAVPVLGAFNSARI
jgi:hypothetical protein